MVRCQFERSRDSSGTVEASFEYCSCVQVTYTQGGKVYCSREPLLKRATQTAFIARPCGLNIETSKKELVKNAGGTGVVVRRSYPNQRLHDNKIAMIHT
jgi:hypothetical protein